MARSRKLARSAGRVQIGAKAVPAWSGYFVARQQQRIVGCERRNSQALAFAKLLDSFRQRPRQQHGMPALARERGGNQDSPRCFRRAGD